jgi:uncharacterized protein with HEPN domain
MPRDIDRYLEDIRSACTRIDLYTVGLSYDGYVNASQARDSVERYGEVNDSLVWWTVHNKVPELLRRVREEIKRRREENARDE